jgi:hypothetical protein
MHILDKDSNFSQIILNCYNFIIRIVTFQINDLVKGSYNNS